MTDNYFRNYYYYYIQTELISFSQNNKSYYLVLILLSLNKKKKYLVISRFCKKIFLVFLNLFLFYQGEFHSFKYSEKIILYFKTLRKRVVLFKVFFDLKIFVVT